MLEFGRRFDEHYRCYQLSVGYLHHFDTTKIHTLFNDGDTERVSLLVDVKANDWTKQFIQTFKKV